jgi:hypothetical protein
VIRMEVGEVDDDDDDCISRGEEAKGRGRGNTQTRVRKERVATPVYPPVFPSQRLSSRYARTIRRYEDATLQPLVGKL